MQENLPYSFDPMLNEDELFKTLKDSPLTLSFASVRAKQIIVEAVQSVMVQRLQIQLQLEREQHFQSIQELNQKYNLQLSQNKKEQRTAKKEQTRIESQRKIVSSSFQQQLKQKEYVIKDKQKEINVLNQQINATKEQVSKLRQQLTKMNDLIDQLQQQGQQYAQIVNDQKISIEQYEAVIQNMSEQINLLKQTKGTLQATSSFTKTKYQEDIVYKKQQIDSIRNNHEQDIKQLQKDLKGSKMKCLQQIAQLKGQHQRQLFLLRQQCTRKEYSIKQKNDKHISQLLQRNKSQLTVKEQQYRQSLKKQSSQLQAYKEKYHSFSLVYNKLRATYAQAQQEHKNEAKCLNQRLLNFTHSRNAYLKQNKLIRIKLMQMKKEMAFMRSNIADLPKIFCTNEIKRMTENALENVGSILQKELTNISAILQHKQEQVVQLRRESNEKSQIVKTIEQILLNTNEGTAELMLLLKEKKREEDRLKRELRKNNDLKELQLSCIEKKYNEILRDKSLL